MKTEPSNENPSAAAVACSALLADLREKLIATSEEWRTLPTDPHNINTPVYIALIEVANVIEKVIKSANDQSSATPGQGT
jgi:hypothetical protein